MNLNTQAPEKKSHRGPETLSVHSMFYTIQGEGPFSGHPAYFVRLAGCNLQCPQCDTEYTQGRADWAIAAIVSKVRSDAPKHCKLVVLTGGEPFRQDLTLLIPALCNEGYTVQIETNGSLGPSEDFFRENRHRLAGGTLAIICSPKAGGVNQIIQDMLYFQLIGGYKYLIDTNVTCDEDGLPMQALAHPCAPRLWRPTLAGHFSPARIWLSPVDSGDKDINELNVLKATALAMKHGYRLSLQIHKLIGVA